MQCCLAHAKHCIWIGAHAEHQPCGGCILVCNKPMQHGVTTFVGAHASGSLLNHMSHSMLLPGRLCCHAQPEALLPPASPLLPRAASFCLSRLCEPACRAGGPCTLQSPCWPHAHLPEGCGAAFDLVCTAFASWLSICALSHISVSSGLCLPAGRSAVLCRCVRGLCILAHHPLQAPGRGAAPSAAAFPQWPGQWQLGAGTL